MVESLCLNCTCFMCLPGGARETEEIFRQAIEDHRDDPPDMICVACKAMQVNVDALEEEEKINTLFLESDFN